MKTLRKFWKSVKREPVIFLAILTILAQAFEKAMDTGHFTLVVWMTYVLQMTMAVIARGLVVPGDKFAEITSHRDSLAVDLNRLLQKDYESSDIFKENGGSS